MSSATLMHHVIGGSHAHAPSACAEAFVRSQRSVGGSRYNGYAVDPGYFGAFSIDGLAIALHCIYHTTSFNAAERFSEHAEGHTFLDRTYVGHNYIGHAYICRRALFYYEHLGSCRRL